MFDRRLVQTFDWVLLGLLALLLIAPSAWARPTTDREAQDAVAGWLSLDNKPLGAGIGVKPTRVEAFKDSAGNVDYFVVNLEPAGFAIIAGDDLIEPIIAFAPQGTFDPVVQNPLYNLVRRDLPERLAEVRGKEEQARVQGLQYIPQGLYRHARGKWESLRKRGADTPGLDYAGAPSVSDLRVAPLVQSKWSQSYEGTPSQYCYNYYTPNHYVSGCAATAMAQLMRYYKWPTSGVGTRQSYIYVDGVQQNCYLRGGDGAGGPYNWNDNFMVLDPNANTTDPQRQAIGALTYDAGVAVHMQYADGGSGAYTNNVPTALTGTFGYANAQYGYDSNYPSIPSAYLINMINPNLDAKYPAILGINDTANNGHMVVVDGYGYNVSTLYHHLNLGWAGTADAWYNLPTIDTGYYNFTVVPACVYNVFPQGTGEIISGRILDAAGNPVSGAAITATRSAGGTYNAASNSLGIYALAKIPSSSTYTITVSKLGYNFSSRSAITGKSRTNAITTGNLWGIDFTQNLPGITLNQALDNNSLTFTASGDAPWFAETAVASFGGSAAQSGALKDNQSSWFQTTVVGPGTLSFYWKVSSEANHDFLEVWVDGVAKPGSLSGEFGWQRRSLAISAGSHIIKWVYSKDGSGTLGADCGWVDKVTFFSSKGALTPVLNLLLQE